MIHSSSPQVIGIASGKGGVGKTTVTVNLATALQASGKRVMLLDADLGLANAQLAFGCKTEYHLGHVLSGERRLEETIITTPQRVRLVPGASGVRELAALDNTQVASIIHAFSQLTEPVDYLLVDVAAGLSPSVLAFLAACQRRFVIVCDQPASIADAYGLIKVMSKEEQLDEMYLIPNMVTSPAAGQQLFQRIAQVCDRFLDQIIHPLPPIVSDEWVPASQKQYQSVVDHAPGSAAARDFRRLAQAVTALPPIHNASGRIQFFMERMLHPS